MSIVPWRRALRGAMMSAKWLRNNVGACFTLTPAVVCSDLTKSLRTGFPPLYCSHYAGVIPRSLSYDTASFETYFFRRESCTNLLSHEPLALHASVSVSIPTSSQSTSCTTVRLRVSTRVQPAEELAYVCLLRGCHVCGSFSYA